MQHYPALTVNLDAMRQNAQVLCDLCGKNNISVAGVIKFSDGDLQVAKAYADAHPGQPPLITVNSWNEWTETSYLEPDDLYGYGYLEAIRRVFTEE